MNSKWDIPPNGLAKTFKSVFIYNKLNVMCAVFLFIYQFKLLSVYYSEQNHGQVYVVQQLVLLMSTPDWRITSRYLIDWTFTKGKKKNRLNSRILCGFSYCKTELDRLNWKEKSNCNNFNIKVSITLCWSEQGQERNWWKCS